MANNQKPTDFIKPHAHEAVKQFITYDGLDRMEYHYVALTEAQNGTPCLVTQYVYSGTSGRVIKAKESLAVWSSAYDI